MKLSNIRCLVFLLLFSQQVFAVYPNPPPAGATCPVLQADCDASKAAMAVNSSGDAREFRGSCVPSVFSSTTYFVGFQCQWVGQTNSWISCYSNYCEKVSPTCTAPQVLDTATNTCITPVAPPSGGTTTSTGGSCDSVMSACQAKVQEAISGGSLRLMQCEQRTSPESMVCVADNSGTGSDARCMICPNGKSASDFVYGNGTSLPDFTPKTDLAKRETDCKAGGGSWASDGSTWTCTTATGSTSYNADGSAKSKPIELNCGGTTGIACESTQLSVDKSLKDLLNVFDKKGTDPSKDVKFEEVNLDAAKTKLSTITDSMVSKIGEIPEVVTFKKIWADTVGGTSKACPTEITDKFKDHVMTGTSGNLTIPLSAFSVGFCSGGNLIRSIIILISMIGAFRFAFRI